MIEAVGLAKSFGPRTALERIDLSIPAGQFAVLVGPNGAGKTTLLRILATLTRPTRGTVCVGGLDPRQYGEQVRRRLGFLSHRTLLYDDLTAEQNLRFYGRMYDLPKNSSRARDLLERVGLGLRSGDLVRTFSRGMRQRLAVARAVLHEPEVLLLDEPYAGLDTQAVETLTDLLVGLAGEGRAILLTTHRLNRGLSAGHRVLVLHSGRLVYDERRDAVALDEFLDTYRTITG
ncbi:MAG: heme ABC exporter ATP-binding protein CcmA [Anaerolineae bacterium]|jgi:heme exporter protein A